MDQIQVKLQEMIKEVQDCFESRQRFKSILADYIPGEKLKTNLLLNAFDEEIVDKLKSTSDKTFVALNIAKQLTENYGITNSSAVWAVSSWCYILGYSDVAQAIALFETMDNDMPTSAQVKSIESKECILGVGVYRAGTDFPAGDLKIQAKGKVELDIFYGISKSPNKIDTSESFKDQIYIRIEEGEFLKIMTFEDEIQYKLIVTSL